MAQQPAIALITGASSGIGEQFARQLSARCDELILTGRRQQRLQALADELNSDTTRCTVIAEDLGTTIGIARLMETIRQRGPLSYLVNNAGFSTFGDFDAQSPDSQATMVSLHVTATMQLTLAALGGMRSAGSGAIINVSSLVALGPFRGVAVYSGTKAFLNNFSSALQQEVAADGIRVQCLCPGYTRTEFHQQESFEKFDAQSVPEHLWMEAIDVVTASLQALDGSDEQVIVVPGAQNQAMAQKMLKHQLTQFAPD